MLSGSSELWAAFPPACVNLQLDTSPFTCFSLGYPPLPPPLLPQPGSKLSEIRACFLSSCLSTPNQELQHCWAASPAPSHPSYPIPSSPHPIPSSPHPIAPTLAPPALSRSRVAPLLWELRGEAVSVSARAVPFQQKGCFVGETDGELLYLSSFFPIIFSLPFLLYVFLSFFPYPSPSFPSRLYLLFPSLSCILSFSSLFLKSLSFPSLSSVYSISHKNTITGYSLGKV